tara:strand:+ start:119 stop:478 length:360 start_codon:yes stop_codon:yes gene_type:complete
MEDYEIEIPEIHFATYVVRAKKADTPSEAIREIWDGGGILLDLTQNLDWISQVAVVDGKTTKIASDEGIWCAWKQRPIPVRLSDAHRNPQGTYTRRRERRVIYSEEMIPTRKGGSGLPK